MKEWEQDRQSDREDVRVRVCVDQGVSEFDCEDARKELVATLAPTQLHHHPAEDLSIHIISALLLPQSFTTSAKVHLRLSEQFLQLA